MAGKRINGWLWVLFCALLVSAAVDRALAEPAKLRICARCHGTNGISTHHQIPNLAGQKPAYLLKQLKAFQEGVRFKPSEDMEMDPVPDRKNRVMGQMSVKLNDEEAAAIIRHYAEQRCRVVEVTPEEQLTNRCTECHGTLGKSSDPEIPNLAGQKLGYLVNQLKAFRRATKGIDFRTEKNWRRHPVMMGVIADISETEVSSLRYFSGLGCR